VDHPVRAQLRHRTHQVPHLRSRELGRDDALLRYADAVRIVALAILDFKRLRFDLLLS
jgi:hypothetical protein